MITLAAMALFAAEPVGLGDAVQALQAGRLEQARRILDVAVGAGTDGEHVDRLLAELEYRTGNWPVALQRYERLAAAHPGESLTMERAGIAAFRMQDFRRAKAALAAATAIPAASWRAWNARGAVADQQRDWAAADHAYDRAIALAPRQAEILNNHGWSLLMRGEWARALPLLEQAAALAPEVARIADNLELARAALAEDLPARRAGESDSGWAARLNDAGVVALAGGDWRRAVAAFAQAIEARAQWFERAANNLALVEQREAPVAANQPD